MKNWHKRASEIRAEGRGSDEARLTKCAALRCGAALPRRRGVRGAGNPELGIRTSAELLCSDVHFSCLCFLACLSAALILCLLTMCVL